MLDNDTYERNLFAASLNEPGGAQDDEASVGEGIRGPAAGLKVRDGSPR